jgi:hypothetical protein
LTGLNIWTIEEVGCTFSSWANVDVLSIAVAWERFGLFEHSGSGTDWAKFDTRFSAGVIETESEVITTGLCFGAIVTIFSA